MKLAWNFSLMSEIWDQESIKMTPKKCARSNRELYSDFTVCTELQQRGLDG